MNARSSGISGALYFLMYSALALCIFAFLMSAPIVARAQTQANLSTTIRSAILSDPRSSSMTPAQIDSLVTALTKQAEVQGVTAHDIAWRPEVPGPSQPVVVQTEDSCGSVPAMVCALNQQLGLPGGSWWPSMTLFVLLLLLVLITAIMIERGKKRKVVLPL